MTSNVGAIQVTGITTVEDETHPESWVRDAYLEAWDSNDAKWRFVMPLFSNSQIHSRSLPQRTTSAKFQVIFPPGMVGNLYLSVIVLHGRLEATGGAAH